MNKQVLLNEGWAFKKNDNEWQTVNLPHDWLIADVNHLYEESVGCYQKIFEVDSACARHFLRFYGVYMDCSVYINGEQVGEWKFGYTSFEFEITQWVTSGENTVEVVVRHDPVNSRWYSGAGIYRNVYLVSTPDTYIPYGGVYISPVKKADHTWEVKVDTEIDGDQQGITIVHEIVGNPPGLVIDAPVLWDIEKTHVYRLRTKLIKNGKTIYQEMNTFGLREIAFDREKGFFLNGKPLKINGVCQHHDLGALGAAFYPDALRRQFEKLKAMGVNGLRTAHNPPDPYFMQLADEMGFVVVSELFDMWERPKTSKDYARFFNEWYQKDVEAWVKRDRNHPSLIMWSVGNEVYDTHADHVRGAELLAQLVAEVKKHDPHQNAFVTLGSNYLPWENTQWVADTLPEPKLVGYNYGEYLYEAHHVNYPDWIIYGSETGSVVQSRGIYHFPLSQSVLADDDLQCSSLGNSATSWGAKSPQHCIDMDQNAPFSLGQFIWTGTDYIGEPTPYHTKNSYFGQIDTAGFEKDSFYVYQANWSDTPMIHLFPYWDFSPGQLIDVQAVSNGTRFEVYLNDRLISTSSPVQIPYERGTLKAVSYDQSGQVIASCERQSFGDTRLLVIEEKTVGELVFAEIQAVDEQGRRVENANDRVVVTVKNGTLLGLDNGDSTDQDPYQNTNNKRLFSGKLLAIATIGSQVTATLCETEIPIRKIELVSSNKLDQRQPTTTVQATIYPPNASYEDLHWRVTDAAGIDTNIASFEISDCGTAMTLTAKGDGVIFVRCATKNGKAHLSLISYLDFKVTGLGKAYLNPYELVAGGLYNRSNQPMTNGNERGVATLRDGESQVGFADLDFGEIGSDQIHLPIFAMTPEPFEMDIWEGMPDDGGTWLTTITYTSGTQWNTYRTETHQLPKKLTGVTTLCFVVNRKIHLKGFWFTKKEKAYTQLSATSFTQVYGDSYQVEAHAITGIGNNVTIEFSGMQMSEEPVQLLVHGRSLINNTIHLKFDDGQSQILEFKACEDYTTQHFLVSGKATEKVSFVFLPGSNFDFANFRFITPS